MIFLCFITILFKLWKNLTFSIAESTKTTFCLIFRLRLQPSILNKEEDYEKSSVKNDEDDIQHEKIKPQIKHFTASTWYEDEKNTSKM